MPDREMPIHHLDEIDTTVSGWESNIDKVRYNGTIYTVKQDAYNGRTYLLNDES